MRIQATFTDERVRNVEARDVPEPTLIKSVKVTAGSFATVDIPITSRKKMLYLKSRLVLTDAVTHTAVAKVSGVTEHTITLYPEEAVVLPLAADVDSIQLNSLSEVDGNVDMMLL